jgi:hypothetical protein
MVKEKERRSEIKIHKNTIRTIPIPKLGRVRENISKERVYKVPVDSDVGEWWGYLI